MAEMNQSNSDSPERVAYDLMRFIRSKNASIGDDVESILNIYRNCLWAVQNPLEHS